MLELIESNSPAACAWVKSRRSSAEGAGRGTEFPRSHAATPLLRRRWRKGHKSLYRSPLLTERQPHWAYDWRQPVVLEPARFTNSGMSTGLQGSTPHQLTPRNFGRRYGTQMAAEKLRFARSAGADSHNEWYRTPPWPRLSMPFVC